MAFLSSLAALACLLIGAVPLSQAVVAAAATVDRILTAQDSSDRLTPQTPLSFTSTWDDGLDTLSFYPERRFQSILGFGGAFTDASAVNIFALPEPLQQEAIHAYYNATTGHGYNWGRIPMGSCDFTTSSYSYDDVVDDFDLTHFDTNATRDRTTLIPLILKATEAAGAPLRLFATPWSPPAWMKTNNNMNGTSSPCLRQDDQQRYQKAWALYFLKWIQTYEKYGVPIWGVTIQNEPEAAQIFESCLYSSPYEEMDFLAGHLYPTVHPVYPQLQFLGWDHNKDHVVAYAHAFFSNATVRDMVWGLGVHWYTGGSFDNVQQVTQRYPEKGIMATEACNCPVSVNNWEYGERYGHDILQDLNVGVQGWTDWNLVLDDSGGPNHVGGSCDAPIIRLANNTLNYQPSYYYMGHFSRYLPRGAIRVMHQFTGSDSLLEITTWEVDVGQQAQDSGVRESVRGRVRETGVEASGREVVVIVLNRQREAQSFQLTTGWYTPGSLQATVAVPAHSIQTLHFDAALLNTTRPESGGERSQGGASAFRDRLWKYAEA